jgi:hypothetical protein
MLNTSNLIGLHLRISQRQERYPGNQQTSAYFNMLPGNIANNTTGSQQPALVSASNSASATPESIGTSPGNSEIRFKMGNLISELPGLVPMLLSVDLAYKVNYVAISAQSELPEYVHRSKQAESERTDIGTPEAMSNERPSTARSVEEFTPQQIEARCPGVQFDPKWLAVAEGDSMLLNPLYGAMGGPVVPLKGKRPPSTVEELSRLVPHLIIIESSC